MTKPCGAQAVEALSEQGDDVNSFTHTRAVGALWRFMQTALFFRAAPVRKRYRSVSKNRSLTVAARIARASPIPSDYINAWRSPPESYPSTSQSMTA